jgi:hypothetical protein
VTSPIGIRVIARPGRPDVAAKIRPRSRRSVPKNNVLRGVMPLTRFPGTLPNGLILLASLQKRAQLVAPVQSDNQANKT